MTARRPHVVDVERRYGRHGTRLLDRLREAAERAGGLSAEAVAAVAAEQGLPRAHVHGAASYYADLAGDWGPSRVRACAGTACFACTGGGHLAEVRGAAGRARLAVEEVRCVGYCYAAPSALAGETPCTGAGLGAQIEGRIPPRAPEPAVASAVDDPVTLAGLVGAAPAAWESWPRALTRGPEPLLEAVDHAGLSGRGGAAFPVAHKWSAVRRAGAGPRYVVANGDEGDPGSFADRLLMERDPHRVLEGLALAGLACGASRGFAYVRSEYPAAREALRAAVAEAGAAGHLGRDVHGSGIDFEVEVAVGAGSYVAGEETALIASLEGVRGGAQVRPPYPAQDGFERSPTAVNNVETLCAVPWIVAFGGEAFARRGTPASRGTKLVSLSERFARPGVYEVELGTPAGTVCEDLGGGLRDGARLRSLQVGGPLGGFLGPGELEAPLSYEGMRAAGIELGHGGLVAIDARRSGAELLEHLCGFAADESCGNCAPCRVGSRRGLELASRIAAEGAREDLLSELDRVLAIVGSASLCGLGLGIAPAVRSLMRVYADELDPAGAGA